MQLLVPFLAVLFPFVINQVGPVQQGYASVYNTGTDAEFAGQVVPYLGRKLTPQDALIASKFIPKGTVVQILSLRTGRKVRTVVKDSGPYGACTKKGWTPTSDNAFLPRPCPKGKWRVKRKRSGKGRWRGIADLTPPVARQIGSNGFELVRIKVLKYPDGYQEKLLTRMQESFTMGSLIGF